MIGKHIPIEPVPIDYFLDWIAKVTGWDKDEFLKSKDIGDVERELGICE
jgi:hypothetical protein